MINNLGIALLKEFALQRTMTSGQLVRVMPSYQGRQWPFLYGSSLSR